MHDRRHPTAVAMRISNESKPAIGSETERTMRHIEDGHDAVWSGPVVSRRTAIGYTGVLASAAVLTGCNFDGLQPEIGSPEPMTGDGPHTFSFVHDETVRVIVSPNVDLSKFDLTVRADTRASKPKR